MRIAITGFAGYLGSALVDRLSQRPELRIVGYDSLVFKHLNLDNLDFNNNVEIVLGDILEPQELLAAFADCDLVVHLAALVGDKFCDMYPEMAKRVNVEGTRNVVEAAIKSGISRIIFTSTTSIYGVAGTDDFLTEDSPINPVSLYAETKLQAEKEIRALCAHHDISVTVLRLATVFGLSPFTRFDLLINSLAATVAAADPVELYGIESYRPYISVDNILDIITHVIDHPDTYQGFQLFNAGFTQNNFSKRDLKHLIQAEYPKAEIVLNEQKKDPRSYRVDFSAIETTLEKTLMSTINVVHPVTGLAKVTEAIASAQIGHSFINTDRTYRGHA